MADWRLIPPAPVICVSLGVFPPGVSSLVIRLIQALPDRLDPIAHRRLV